MTKSTDSKYYKTKRKKLNTKRKPTSLLSSRTSALWRRMWEQSSWLRRWRRWVMISTEARPTNNSSSKGTLRMFFFHDKLIFLAIQSQSLHLYPFPRAVLWIVVSYLINWEKEGLWLGILWTQFIMRLLNSKEYPQSWISLIAFMKNYSLMVKVSRL